MSEQAALKRALGLRDLTLFYVVSGLSVRWVASAAAAGPSTLVVWVIALVAFFVPLAASVIELSSRYPQEGGLYVWTRVAFGDFWGFMSAWMYWMSNLPYFPAVLYFGAASVLFALPSHRQVLAADSGYYAWFAVGWLLVITVLNVVGLNIGKWLNNVGTLGSVVPLGVLFALAAVSAWRFGSATRFSGTAMAPHLSLGNAIFYSTIFFAFGGCEAGSFMGDEIRDPRRTVPRALLMGGAVLAVGYLAGTLAMLVALPGSEVGGPDGFVLGLAALCSRLGVGWMVAPLALLVGWNAVGGAAAFLSSTSRLPFVAGIDRYLPASFGKIHPRFRTPWVAIATYGAAGMAVALLGQAGTTVRGAYNVLVSMSIIAYFLPYLLLFAATIRLQGDAFVTESTDAVRIPGGRYAATALAVVGLLSTAATIVLSVVPAVDELNKTLAVVKVLLLTGLLVGGGVAVFVGARRKQMRVEGRG